MLSAIPDALTWYDVLKDVFQIAPLVIIAIITWCTYASAKKSILQPIKTEVFKEQLKVFSEVLAFFGGKSETDLRRDAAVDDLFRANVAFLYDLFGTCFFNLPIDEAKSCYAIDKCPMSLFSLEALDVADAHVFEEQSPQPPADSRELATRWSEYETVEIKLPRRLCEYRHKLERIQRSPLLPKPCSKLIEEYLELLAGNIATLGELLTECARELPEKYPNREEFAKADASWIHTKYIERFLNLETKASEIDSFVREYFYVEDLLK